MIQSHQTKYDSILISKKQLFLATNAMAELKYYKKMEWYHQNELHSKDIEIDFYKKGLNQAIKANNICDSISNKYITLDNSSQIEVLKWKQEAKRQKRAKIGSTIGGITGMIITFTVGFLLGHYVVK